MIAEKNEYTKEASKTIFQLSADEQIRKRCLDREEYYSDLRSHQREIARMQNVIKEKEATITQQAAENANLRKEIEELQKQINNKQ